MQLNDLKNVGLTEGEIKVYTSLLELGESTKTPLVERSNVSSSKIYDILHRLQEKGLVSYIKQDGIKHFRVAPPEQLYAYLNKREEEISNEKSIIESLMPLLKTLYKKTELETDAEIFKGWKGIETVYNNIIDQLNPGETDYVFGASKGEDIERTRLFFNRFNNKRHKKGIQLKVIFNNDTRDNIRTLHKKRDKVRYMDQTTPAEINISNDMVVILVLTSNPLAVVIKNKNVAKSFIIFFEAMWSIAND